MFGHFLFRLLGFGLLQCTVHVNVSCKPKKKDREVEVWDVKARGACRFITGHE